MAVLLMNACQKDCPNRSNDTFTYYKFDNIKKQTFPYHFKDSQVWINLNTNDTLNYVIKDTISSYDTISTTHQSECPVYDVDYKEKFSYKFKCLQDSNFNYNHIFYRDGFITRNILKFNNIEFVEYGSKLLDIDNNGIIYKNIYVSKYFAESDSLGIVRITVGDVKLYRIK